MKLLNKKAERDLKGVMQKLPAIEKNLTGILTIGIKEETITSVINIDRVAIEFSHKEPLSLLTQNKEQEPEPITTKSHKFNDTVINPLERAKYFFVFEYVVRKVKVVYSALKALIRRI